MRSAVRIIHKKASGAECVGGALRARSVVESIQKFIVVFAAATVCQQFSPTPMLQWLHTLKNAHQAAQDSRSVSDARSIARHISTSIRLCT